MPSKFVYLLNAMEEAAKAENPSQLGYAAKRQAVLEYVAVLEDVVECEDKLIVALNKARIAKDFGHV